MARSSLALLFVVLMATASMTVFSIPHRQEMTFAKMEKGNERELSGVAQGFGDIDHNFPSNGHGKMVEEHSDYQNPGANKPPPHPAI